MADYDVFVSYSGDERAIVEEIANQLRALGLKVWFDRWVLPPGEPWHRYLLEGVEQSAATVLFVGAGGLGKYQEIEMEAAIDKQISKGDHRVVPAILPGTPEDKIKLPIVLKRVTWVLLPENLHDRSALERLYWGITGNKLGNSSKNQDDAARRVTERAIDSAVSDLREALRITGGAQSPPPKANRPATERFTTCA